MPHLTHEEIAEAIPCGRVAVTRELARFEEAGLIRRAGRRIFIPFGVQTVSSLERASIGKAAPAKPQRLRTQSNRRPAAPLPVESYGIPVTYYSVRGDLQSILTLNNKGPDTMDARVTLYSRDGRRHGTNVSIPAHTFLDLDLRPIAAAAGEGFEDGSLRVSYTARIMELGGMLRITNLASGIEYDEQLMYPNKTRSNRLEGV